MVTSVFYREVVGFIARVYFILIYVYVCLSSCGYVHLSAGTLRDQRISDPLELQLLVVLSHLICILGNDPV